MQNLDPIPVPRISDQGNPFRPVAASRIPGQDNPHLPADTIPLDVFNIIPGAAFMLIDQPDPRVWIAEKVARDVDFERVSIWAHDGTDADQDANNSLAHEQAFNMDFCTKVALVGIVVNHADHDDNNWGN